MQFPKLFNPVDFRTSNASEKIAKSLRDPYLLSHIFIFLLFTFLPFYLFTFLKPQKALAQSCRDWCAPGGNECERKYGAGYICQDTGCDPTGIMGDCVDNGGKPPPLTDKERCQKQGGSWNAEKGECLKKTTTLCDENGYCPDGSKGEQTAFGCFCNEIIFKGKGQKIRVHVEPCKSGAKGIETALGCIPTDPEPFIGWVFKLGTFLGGGIAFLLMAWGTFLTMSSSGNPDQLKQGKDIIVSAVSGLLFIIFAVFLLRLIGVDILKIPGFR